MKLLQKLARLGICIICFGSMNCGKSSPLIDWFKIETPSYCSCRFQRKWVGGASRQSDKGSDWKLIGGILGPVHVHGFGQVVHNLKMYKDILYYRVKASKSEQTECGLWILEYTCTQETRSGPIPSTHKCKVALHPDRDFFQLGACKQPTTT